LPEEPRGQTVAVLSLLSVALLTLNPWQVPCDDGAVPANKPVTALPLPPFDLKAFLDSAGAARTIRKFARSAVIFSQGDAASHVFYIQSGSVKLSVLSRTGKVAVVAVLGQGEFFGEGCLAAQPRRIATASALSASTVLIVEKPQMLEMLHTQPALAERFLAHMLARNIRVEEDLVDQLFNSSEKRLARVLLLLARYGRAGQPLKIPRMSQETLAEIVGTTRSRVNFFMNKFRKLGFIEYNGDITVNNSLLTVVLHD
jgi:CRP-like cAMP-binding protein